MESQTKTVLTIVVLVVIVLAGAMYFRSQKMVDDMNTNPEDEGVICSMEAKECPDGSYVGRTGPDCEFAPCPTTPAMTPPSNDEGVVCAMDAYQCPDGSWVGRSGPNCQFDCP